MMPPLPLAWHVPGPGRCLETSVPRTQPAPGPGTGAAAALEPPPSKV